MASSGTDHIPSVDGAEVSEATIEIKIKTLDAQTYTLRVDKQMPVPALKEQIASVTGVLSDQQRLICRGKVLKDDQLLSAYHVEDGHTLHMIVRQPIPPSSEGLSNHPATDPASTSRHTHQIAPGIVIETFSLPGQGDGGAPPPEISRILSAVLGSMGISGLGSAMEGMENRENGSQRTSGISSMFDSMNVHSEQNGSRVSSGFSLGSLQPPVIPDSLTTLTQFISNIRREFDAIGGVSEERSSQSATAGSRQGFPTPASLAEVVVSARQLLISQAADALLQLDRQLEDQANVTDTSARLSTQSSAMRTGALVHNLGSFLLELGRTIMTLRMGQSPSEAVVNAGPSVFISPTGPNPIMVQPLPFQVGSSFGSIPMGAVQSGSGLVNGLGSAYIPRRIDIQIRRGSPTATATANANREEQGNTQQPSGQRNPTTNSGESENPSNQGTSRATDGPGFATESGVRVVPLRTVVASVPGSFGRLSSDSSGNFLEDFQHVATNGHDIRSKEVTELDGNGLTQTLASSRQAEPTISTRSVSINILSAGGLPNGESERQIPGGVMQFIRNLFPGGEIHVEDGSSEAVAAGSPGPDQAVASGGAEAGQEAEPMATDEGVFLSNILRQIMPLIPGQAGSDSEVEPSNASELGMAHDSSTQVENSEAGTSSQAGNSSAGASRRPDDCESGSPNSKRHKTE